MHWTAGVLWYCWVVVLCAQPDGSFPIAHTCFFSIDLPAYSTDEIMRKKLTYAMTHTVSIDADASAAASEWGQMNSGLG